MHLIRYYPYYSCLCTFWPYHPYLACFFNLFSCFLYLFVFLLSSIATESEGCGLVHSLWHALCADIDRSSGVIYPRNSRVFMLHSFLEFYELSATTNSDCY